MPKLQDLIEYQRCVHIMTHENMTEFIKASCAQAGKEALLESHSELGDLFRPSDVKILSDEYRWKAINALIQMTYDNENFDETLSCCDMFHEDLSSGRYCKFIATILRNLRTN